MIDKQRLLRAGLAYQEQGWPVFVLRPDKGPFGNCAACANERPAHAEACACLLCHGFYAASLDAERLEKQLAATPEGSLLAVRLGGSGLCVVDAEGDDRSGVGITGVDALEEVEWEWPETRRSRTGSGGVHLWYRVVAQEGQAALSPGSRTKVLPNVDIKGTGGYVLVPPAQGRSWMNWSCSVAEIPEGSPLGVWLLSARGHGGKPGTGGAGTGLRGSLALRTADVIPAGRRYEFVRDLVYALRRRGASREATLAELAVHYARMQQPPAAAYELPWSQVEYEVDRVFWRVEPEPPLAAALASWMSKVRES